MVDLYKVDPNKSVQELLNERCAAERTHRDHDIAMEAAVQMQTNKNMQKPFKHKLVQQTYKLMKHGPLIKLNGTRHTTIGTLNNKYHEDTHGQTYQLPEE